MSSQVINIDQAFTRISSIYSKWLSDKFKDAFSALIIQNGKDEEKSVKIKTTAIHLWLFGTELVDTLLIFSLKTIILIAGDKKIPQLKKLETKFKESTRKMLLLQKSQVSNESHFEKIREVLSQESKTHRFGVLVKEKQVGALVTETEKELFAALQHETFDVAMFLCEMYMVKTVGELNFMRMSGQAAVYFGKKIVDGLEYAGQHNQKISHKKFAEVIEKMLEDNKELEKAKSDLGFNLENLDFTYTPIIQSGGHFDMRPTAESSDKQLQYEGAILWNLSTRFMNYNSLIVRTCFINPTEIQKVLYQQCLDVFKRTLEKIKPGLIIKELFSHINEELKGVSPELYEKKPNSYGFGIGLEFKEMPLSITEKNDRKLEEGMTIALIFAFNNLGKTPEQSFAIMIADTLIISSLGIENLSSRISKEYDQISYSYEEETQVSTSTLTVASKGKGKKPDSEEKKSNGKGKIGSTKKVREKDRGDASSSTTAGETMILGRTRGRKSEDMIGVLTENKKLLKHQIELVERKNQEYRERLESNNFEAGVESIKTITTDEIVTYKSPKEMPLESSSKEIGIDKKRFALLFPIPGESGHYPVHISLLKNVSKFNDNPFSYVRFNFFNPNEKFKGLIFPKTNPEFFLKELCYRSTDANKMTYIVKSVKDLQKGFKMVGAKQINSESEDATIKTLKTPILAKLKDVKFRPTISGRKTEGHLELYENGVRFISSKSETVDIFFNQVKQVFFQPCVTPSDLDYIVAIHFHCKTPVKVLGKFMDDVQVFVEALGSAKDIGRDNDSEDENEGDEYERKERLRVNKEFEEFVKKMEHHSGIQCDIPFKSLAFQGMPNRGLVSLKPTKGYLINLQEKPFFILCLEEVDFVCFERVFGGIKNFDMVFVLKDFNRPVIRIMSISKDSLPMIKEWIDSMDLVFGESKISMNWPNLIQNARENPKDFVDQGGWTALAAIHEAEEDEEEDASDDSNFDEAEFEESESEESDYEEGDESYSEEGDDSEEENFSDLVDDEEEEEEESEDQRKKSKKKGTDKNKGGRPAKKRP